jgi:hypothetical protein
MLCLSAPSLTLLYTHWPMQKVYHHKNMWIISTKCRFPIYSR